MPESEQSTSPVESLREQLEAMSEAMQLSKAAVCEVDDEGNCTLQHDGVAVHISFFERFNVMEVSAMVLRIPSLDPAKALRGSITSPSVLKEKESKEKIAALNKEIQSKTNHEMVLAIRDNVNVVLLQQTSMSLLQRGQLKAFRKTLRTFASTANSAKDQLLALNATQQAFGTSVNRESSPRTRSHRFSLNSSGFFRNASSTELDLVGARKRANRKKMATAA